MKIKLIAVLLILNITAQTMLAPIANAVTGPSWKPGNIIANSLFMTSGTMSVSDIQAFLNSKVGTGSNGTPGQCDTNGVKTSEFGGGTRADYGAAHNNLAPFTCLKDYYEVPKITPGPSVPANNYGGAAIPVGAKSAANLIYDAAQTYRINPKVLLVTIQKESSGPLITDDWPFLKQYTYAMGAHCPDSGPGGSANCDVNYSGFSIQISESAALFRYYLDNMSQPWWPYKKVGNNTVQYNPNAACGSTVVNIENSATAALYTYTPYQPNQAALNNLYGLGDSCSAYGNRNFWRMYNDWFGSTLGADYAWELTGQSAQKSDIDPTPVNLSTLRSGDRIYLGFTALNTGDATWTKTGPNPVFVGTTSPADRLSPMRDVSWQGLTRPAVLTESNVPPGGIGTFKFWVTIPSNPGDYTEYYSLLAEEKTWMNNIGLNFTMRVIPDIYSWQLTSQYAFTNQAKTTPTGLGNLSPGQKVYVGITAKNTGNVTWVNSGTNPVFLGTSHEQNRVSRFMNGSGWQSPIRAALLKEASVAPGESGTFEFWMTAPYSSPGEFREYFNLLSEGKAWMNDLGLNFSGTLANPTYSWALNYQYAFSDRTKTTPIGLNNMKPNDTALIGISIKNTGSATWYKNGLYPMHLGTSRPTARNSPFYTAGWPGYSRPANMTEDIVSPGQNATFEFMITAPTTKDHYLEYFNPVVEGINWLTDIGLNYSIYVN